MGEGGRLLKLYILLVENVNLAIATPRPGDNLILISLKHDDRSVSESGTTDGGVGVIGHIVKVTKDNVICNDVCQIVKILTGGCCVGD